MKPEFLKNMIKSLQNSLIKMAFLEKLKNDLRYIVANIRFDSNLISLNLCILLKTLKANNTVSIGCPEKIRKFLYAS